MRLLNRCSFVRIGDESPSAITGGRGKGESLEAWKTRLRSELAQQEHAEQERAEQERAEQSRAEERSGLELKETDGAPVERSSSSGGGGSEDRFRAQVASFADLNELTRENRETLEEVKRLLGRPARADTLPPGTELTFQLGELDSLIAMAKTLAEMTVSASLAVAALGTQQRWVGAGA